MMTMDQWIFVVGLTAIYLMATGLFDKFIYLFFRNRG